jgi:DNA-binding response OmpR family regulator
VTYSSTKLRVMAIASTMTILRLNANIDNNTVDLIGLTEISEAFSRLHQERFNIILVDSLLEEAGDICQYICKMACAPIALLVKEPEANWKKLGGWEVDGFLTEGSSKAELAARIKAISRRGIMTPRENHE